MVVFVCFKELLVDGYICIVVPSMCGDLNIFIVGFVLLY